MAGMKVLYIGGTGEISYSCVQASTDAGHHCTVFNRGLNEEPLPTTTRQIVGDVNDAAAYSVLARERFDVVCQFTAYKLSEIDRDISIFGGKCGQYVFISTASAYQKPPTTFRLTEDVPLGNPFWPYSQAKADMEAALMKAHAQGKIAATIVRPSHTFRRRFPGTFVKGDINAWRMLHDRPIVVHGDGNAIWTLTHSEEFAQPFVRLLGRKQTLGEAYHIAPGGVYMWDFILNTMAEALGVKARLVHVPSETLIRYNKEWIGPLLGDKGWCATFDQSKLSAIVGEMPRIRPLHERFAQVAEFYRERARTAAPDRELHALLDRIAAEQARLGT